MYNVEEPGPEDLFVWSVSHREISYSALTHLPLDKMATILADDVFRRNFVDEKFCSLMKNLRFYSAITHPYPEPVVFQWQSSGNPVYLELRPQCTLECHWRNASVLPVVFQWCSSGFPVVFQCVPIMQINTGSPLGHHWVLASASVVPVASQCTCGSSGLPVCSNYAN